MDNSKAGIIAVLISLIFISIGGYVLYEAYLVYETDEETYLLDRKDYVDAPQVEVENEEPVLLQVCPEAWYENKMPMVFDDTSETTFTGGEGSKFSSQYVIINGERVEMNEVDVPWIQQNCEVSAPETIY